MKSYIGIKGNEAADKKAKGAAEEQTAQGGAADTALVTEGEIKQDISARRKEERQQAGWGLGRIPLWGRRAVTWYTYLRKDRGPVGK